MNHPCFLRKSGEPTGRLEAPPPPPGATQTWSDTVVGGRGLHPSLQETMLLSRSYRPVLSQAFPGGLPLASGDAHA